MLFIYLSYAFIDIENQDNNHRQLFLLTKVVGGIRGPKIGWLHLSDLMRPREFLCAIDDQIFWGNLDHC